MYRHKASPSSCVAMNEPRSAASCSPSAAIGAVISCLEHGLQPGGHRLAGHRGPQQQHQLIIAGGGVLPPVHERPDQHLAALPGRNREQVRRRQVGRGRGGEQPGLGPEVAHHHRGVDARPRPPPRGLWSARIPAPRTPTGPPPGWPAACPPTGARRSRAPPHRPRVRRAGPAPVLVFAVTRSPTGSPYRAAPCMTTTVCQRMLTSVPARPTVEANSRWQTRGTPAVGRRADHARRYQARFRPHAGFILARPASRPCFVALLLSAFHAPSPHDLPVGIAAPAAVTGQVEDALNSGRAERLRPARLPAAPPSLRAAIAHREVEGAVIASRAGLRLLVAQAGGTGPAQALTRAFGTLAARSGRPLTVTDVVPPLPGDTAGPVAVLHHPGRPVPQPGRRLILGPGVPPGAPGLERGRAHRRRRRDRRRSSPASAMACPAWATTP